MRFSQKHIDLALMMLDEDKSIDPAHRENFPRIVQQFRDDIAALEDLISHCWVHSGYANCGYAEMDSQKQQLFDEVLERRNRKVESP